MTDATKKLNGLFITFMIAFTMAHAQQPGSPSPIASSSQEAPAAQFPEANDYANTNLTYKIIDAPNNTFCYDVFADGRLMIHQTSAPGLPGNEGFKAKADAEKVAQLVIDKIKKGEMPPTISTDELKKLDVTK
jgi:hypothetical protein